MGRHCQYHGGPKSAAERARTSGECQSALTLNTVPSAIDRLALKWNWNPDCAALFATERN